MFPLETFAPLSTLPFIHHAFTLRATTDTKSDDHQPRLLHSLGYTTAATAEQTHGNSVAVVSASSFDIRHPSFPGVDALITNLLGLPLVIRCADCAPVFIVDPVHRAIALIHSGKQGTRLNITGNTIAALKENFRTNPADCRACIGPSIGPCHYEMNLWEEIETQLRATGLTDIHNPHICTACHLDRYYSYRAEQGQTGRMFALLTLT